MKIVLVITDSRRKNLVFVTDTLKTISIDEAVALVDKGKIEGTHIVRKATGAYIRTNPGVPKSDELETLSLTSKAAFSYLQDSETAVSTPALTNYLKLYLASLTEGGPFIEPVKEKEKTYKVLTVVIKEKFLQYDSIIFSGAEKFNVDPYLLGAIIIDEIARMQPFENILDKLQAKIIGMNTSIGTAQVTTETANNLIKEGLYNPNKNDSKLPFQSLDNRARAYLYQYLIQPKHSIFFAAARMRFLIDEWKEFIDLNHKPEIIATLYGRKYKAPHSEPKPSERGSQIMKEFYPLAKKWLK